MTAASLPISIIVPAWGAAYTANLARALDSVAEAKQRIVVGDEVAARVWREAGASEFVELQVKQPGIARAQGLAAATEPFVLFMDADDEVMPGALEELLGILQSNPKLVGAAGYMQRTTGGFWPQAKHARLATSPLGVYAMLFRNMLPANGSILLRRQVLMDIRGPLFTTLHAEDWHTALKVRAAGRIRFVHKPTYLYHIVDGSVSHSRRDEARVQVSHDALLNTAEEALGRKAPTLRLVERFFAKPHRDRKTASQRTYYEAQAESVNELDYDA